MLKKLLSATLIASLVIGSSVCAFANDGTNWASQKIAEFNKIKEQNKIERANEYKERQSKKAEIIANYNNDKSDLKMGKIGEIDGISVYYDASTNSNRYTADDRVKLKNNDTLTELEGRHGDIVVVDSTPAYVTKAFSTYHVADTKDNERYVTPKYNKSFIWSFGKENNKYLGTEKKLGEEEME